MPTLAQYLVEYLVRCNKLEAFAETIRKAIAENPYFQVVSVFERFDKFRKGYLEPADFSEFMLQNQVYPTEAELYLIFKDFDRKKTGVVTLDEFEEEILPRENRKLRKDALARHAYPVELKLSIDLEFLLAKYFQDKIKITKELNEIRDKVKIMKSSGPDECFLALDRDRQGFISSTSQIDSFLRRNGKALSNEELQRIYRVLSFHENRQITIDMFREHIDPFGLGCYPGYRQKIHEKEAMEHRFMENRYLVQKSRAQNIYHRENLLYQIQDLHASNRRLRHIMAEQEFQALRSPERYYYRL